MQHVIVLQLTLLFFVVVFPKNKLLLLSLCGSQRYGIRYCTTYCAYLTITLSTRGWSISFYWTMQSYCIVPLFSAESEPFSLLENKLSTAYLISCIFQFLRHDLCMENLYTLGHQIWRQPNDDHQTGLMVKQMRKKLVNGRWIVAKNITAIDVLISKNKPFARRRMEGTGRRLQ